MWHTLAIVGVGLIGGSVGLAVRQRGLARTVVGVGPDAAALRDARQQGIIDEFAPLAEAAAVADVVLICAPVDRIAAIAIDAAGERGRVSAPSASHSRTLEIERHAASNTRGADATPLAGVIPTAHRNAASSTRGADATPLAGPLILSDVGSTKAAIVRAVTPALPPGVAFVGGHPIAGSQRSGHAAARADLFAGRRVVLTPTAATPADALAAMTAFWRALGAAVVHLSPEEHDATLARTSHLPHLVAAALAGVTDPRDLPFSGPGFRDTTRIAAGDPGLWRAICEQNRGPIRRALADFIAHAQAVHAALDRGDDAELESLLAHAKEVRDALGS